MRRMYGALVVAALTSAACGGEENPPPKTPETTAVATTPPPTTPPPAETVTPPAPKVSLAELIQKNQMSFIEAMNARDAKKMGAAYADNAVTTMYGAPADNKGREAIVAGWQKHFDAMSETKGAANRIFMKDKVVVTEWQMTGKHTGEMFGIKATDKQVGLQGVTVTWFDDGGQREKEHVYMDAGTLMSQIGVSKQKARGIPTLTAKPEMLASTGSDGEKKNLDVAKAMADAMNAHDTKAFLASMDDKIEWDDMTQPATSKGKAEAQKYMEMMGKAFPDGKQAFDTSWAFGDFVVAEGTFTGTHKGDFMGAKPTKKTITMHGIDIMQIKDGKVVKGWSYANGGEVAAQLGLMKAPGGDKPADPKAAPKAVDPKAPATTAPKAADPKAPATAPKK